MYFECEVIRIKQHCAIWNKSLRFAKQILQKATQFWKYDYIKEQVTFFESDPEKPKSDKL